MLTLFNRLLGKFTGKGFDGALCTTGLTQAQLEGRGYRAFKEFTANTQLRLTATKPFRLTAQNLNVDTGAVRAVITVGSTAGGTWTALPTKFTKNGLISPAPTPAITVEEGGTITGGTVREVLRANASIYIGAIADLTGDRLLPAGTYYIQLIVTGTTSGIYAIEYDELDAVPL